jgi:hypothetical protein
MGWMCGTLSHRHAIALVVVLRKYDLSCKYDTSCKYDLSCKYRNNYGNTTQVVNPEDARCGKVRMERTVAKYICN